MDDQEFDKRIKAKADNYEVSGFDPAALSALHHQMTAEQVWPWYSRYKSELIISSVLLLCTFAILFSQWNVKSRVQDLENEIFSLQNQNQVTTDLRNEIEYLKSLPPDTIHIIEIREEPSSLNTVLIRKISVLENAVASLSLNNDEYHRANGQNDGDYFSTQGQTLPTSNNILNAGSARLIPHEQQTESLRAEADSTSQVSGRSIVKLSPKKLRELEKHYQKGVGIRVGPTLEISGGVYNKGNGRFDIGGGILSDFILSPSISVETGVKYAHRFYEISSDDGLSDMQFPGTDENLRTLVNADVDSWILEIPLNIKYRYPISQKSHLIAGLGYSSLIYTKQILEYEYEFEDNSPVKLSSSHEETNVEISPGAMNLLLGIDRELKNGKNLETSIYYQHGLGNMGVENNRASFIGLRGVYWFTAR